MCRGDGAEFMKERGETELLEDVSGSGLAQRVALGVLSRLCS